MMKRVNKNRKSNSRIIFNIALIITLLVTLILITSCGKTELEKDPRVNPQSIDKLPSQDEVFAQLDISDSLHKIIYITNNGRVVYQEGNRLNQVIMSNDEFNLLKKKIIDDNQFFTLKSSYEDDRFTDIIGTQITINNNGEFHTSSCNIAFCEEQRYNNVQQLILKSWPKEIMISG